MFLWSVKQTTDIGPRKANGKTGALCLQDWRVQFLQWPRKYPAEDYHCQWRACGTFGTIKHNLREKSPICWAVAYILHQSLYILSIPNAKMPWPDLWDSTMSHLYLAHLRFIITTLIFMHFHNYIGLKLRKNDPIVYSMMQKSSCYRYWSS